MFCAVTPYSRVSRKFGRDESGGATIEAVMWLPIFILFFCLIADVSFILHGQSKAQRIIQDANRFASTGFYLTEAQIEKHVKDQIELFSPNVQVVSDINSTAVRTVAVLPASDLDIIGFFARFTGIDISVGSVHLLEV